MKVWVIEGGQYASETFVWGVAATPEAAINALVASWSKDSQRKWSATWFEGAAPKGDGFGTVRVQSDVGRGHDYHDYSIMPFEVLA